jgi:hypothetical protein
MQELGDRQVGDLVVDRGAEKDDPLPKQVRVDVGSPLPTRVLLDHHRDQRAHYTGSVAESTLGCGS